MTVPMETILLKITNQAEAFQAFTARSVARFNGLPETDVRAHCANLVRCGKLAARSGDGEVCYCKKTP